MDNRASKFPTLLLYVIFLLSPIAWTLNTCGPGQIPCNVYECVSNEKWCDSEKDCSDGNDEKYCKMVHESTWGFDTNTDPDPNNCFYTHHLCENGICYPMSIVCDGYVNCGDYSDEKDCGIAACSENGEVFKCRNYVCQTRGNREVDFSKLLCLRNGEKCEVHHGIGMCSSFTCIPKTWVCDGIIDCNDSSDENECPRNDIERVPNAIKAKRKLTEWFLKRERYDRMTEKWGKLLHRTAAALYLADQTFFTVGNKTGEEIASELSIQLLSKFSQNKNLSTWELALYINSLLASCVDPHNFYGRDLVRELREREETNKNAYLMQIIALCNAKAQMGESELHKIISNCNCKDQPSCIESQALAVMALSCLKSEYHVPLDSDFFNDTILGLKLQQHANGTVVDTRTTALVIQALVAAQDYESPFNLEAAIKMIIDQQKSDGSYESFLDSYYILPALSYSSLINISSDHCSGHDKTENETIEELLLKTEFDKVQCSLFIDADLHAVRSWILRVPRNSSFYDVLEILNESLDYKYRVNYNVLNGKPYVKEAFGIGTDPEQGSYWFLYRRDVGSSISPQFVEASPVDTKANDGDEFILWYKSENCSEDTITTAEVKALYNVTRSEDKNDTLPH